MYTLLKTHRYKVVSIDNHHNSYPTALARAVQIAKDELPADATDQDRESVEVDAVSADLTQEKEIRAVFDKYGPGGVWGVIHVAVSLDIDSFKTCDPY